MFLKVFKDIMQRWHTFYCLHRKSHGCGIREASSWAWWNAWNPTDGARYWRDSYLSAECVAENAKRDKEQRDMLYSCIAKEVELRKKWKDFMGLRVETYLERAKADNKKNLVELQKKIKKAKKSEKRG